LKLAMSHYKEYKSGMSVEKKTWSPWLEERKRAHCCHSGMESNFTHTPFQETEETLNLEPVICHNI
jgi:hypothetical protein